MPVAIQFLAGQGFQIADLAGSGLGFYGDAGFGASVRVGEYQGRTFITNSNGTTHGPEVNNVKFLNIGSGILGQTGSGVALRAIPNHQATLNLRVVSNTPIRVPTARLRAYDRVNENRSPSGVTTRVAQIIHPDINQVANGSGDSTWWTPGGSGVVVPLAPSPGVSGLFAGNGNNSTRPDTQHDWYCAISASPDSIGSKQQYGLWVEIEYQ
jgi:hypothetical protein